MKTKAQMITAEPRIRMPDWRRLSPKKRRTRPLETRPATREPKRAISPKEASQPRGTSSQPIMTNDSASLPARRTRDARLVAPRSSDRLQFGVGGKQDGGEDVVEEED